MRREVVLAGSGGECLCGLDGLTTLCRVVWRDGGGVVDRRAGFDVQRAMTRFSRGATQLRESALRSVGLRGGADTHDDGTGTRLPRDAARGDGDEISVPATRRAPLRTAGVWTADFLAARGGDDDDGDKGGGTIHLRGKMSKGLFLALEQGSGVPGRALTKRESVELEGQETRSLCVVCLARRDETENSTVERQHIGGTQLKHRTGQRNIR
ncbi:hypothetical protein EDB86DRAFT_2830923 [Lactarius hatsudake]|nr:hypothetical protein EDB86DRAFT_2830923 [Lactarius hatsudake]